MSRIRPGTAAWTKAMRALQGSADTSLDQSMGRKAARMAAKPHVVGSIALDERLRGGGGLPQTLDIGVAGEWENGRLEMWFWDQGGDLVEPAVLVVNGQTYPFDEDEPVTVRDEPTTDPTSIVWSVTDAAGGFASGTYVAPGLLEVSVWHDPNVIGRVRLTMAGSGPDFRVHEGDANSPVIYEGRDRVIFHNWEPQLTGNRGCLVIGFTVGVSGGDQRIFVPLHGPGGEFPPGWTGFAVQQEQEPLTLPWDAFTTHAQIDGWAEANLVAVKPEWGQMTIASKRAFLVDYFGGARPWETGN